MKNLSAYKDLQAYGIGATISIPRDLVTEATINREVKVHGGPMRGGYSTSFDAENDFALNSLILAELRKELESKMRLETASTHKKPFTEKCKGTKSKYNHFEKTLKHMSVSSMEQEKIRQQERRCS